MDFFAGGSAFDSGGLDFDIFGAVAAAECAADAEEFGVSGDLVGGNAGISEDRLQISHEAFEHPGRAAEVVVEVGIGDEEMEGPILRGKIAGELAEFEEKDIEISEAAIKLGGDGGTMPGEGFGNFAQVREGFLGPLDCGADGSNGFAGLLDKGGEAFEGELNTLLVFGVGHDAVGGTHDVREVLEGFGGVFDEFFEVAGIGFEEAVDVLSNLAELVAGACKGFEGAVHSSIELGDHLHGVGGGFSGDGTIGLEELFAVSGGEFNGGIAEDGEGELGDGVILEAEAFRDVGVDEESAAFGVEFDLSDVTDGEAVFADGSAGEDSLGVLEGDGDAVGLAEEPAGFAQAEDDDDGDDRGEDHEESDSELQASLGHGSRPCETLGWSGGKFRSEFRG